MTSTWEEMQLFKETQRHKCSADTEITRTPSMYTRLTFTQNIITILIYTKESTVKNKAALQRDALLYKSCSFFNIVQNAFDFSSPSFLTFGRKFTASTKAFVILLGILQFFLKIGLTAKQYFQPSLYIGCSYLLLALDLRPMR